MGQFVVNAKEANAMTYAKLLHKYKNVTDEPFGEAVYYLAQRLADEASEELVNKLTEKSFSFKNDASEEKADNVRFSENKESEKNSLIDETKKQEFFKACEEKELDSSELVNALCDFVINSDKENCKSNLISNFISDFLNGEEENEFDKYSEICEKENVSVEQTFRALISLTVETGRFPFLFDKNQYASITDILKQLDGGTGKSGQCPLLPKQDGDENG